MAPPTLLRHHHRNRLVIAFVAVAVGSFHFHSQLKLLTYFVIVLSIDWNIAHRKSTCPFQASNGDDARYLGESAVRFNSKQLQ